ncbi:hypothetical protein F4824DRAFT_458087 [Ustulina deusta]|nr:hypothetical protein F4824DRAFT_458087 [Ustulina deusta]
MKLASNPTPASPAPQVCDAHYQNEPQLSQYTVTLILEKVNIKATISPAPSFSSLISYSQLLHLSICPRSQSHYLFIVSLDTSQVQLIRASTEINVLSINVYIYLWFVLPSLLISHSRIHTYTNQAGNYAHCSMTLISLHFTQKSNTHPNAFSSLCLNSHYAFPQSCKQICFSGLQPSIFGKKRRLLQCHPGEVVMGKAVSQS